MVQAGCQAELITVIGYIWLCWLTKCKNSSHGGLTDIHVCCVRGSEDTLRIVLQDLSTLFFETGTCLSVG